MNAFVKIILVSHIEASQKNESNLLTAVQKRQLAVDLVVITRQRAGSDGKLAVLRSLPSSQLFIADDNPLARTGSLLEENLQKRHLFTFP